jgi:hypothetical protein
MSIKKLLSVLIDRVVNKFMESYLLKNNQNIKQEFSNRSLKSTVNYIEKNMINIASVDSKWQLHDIALNSVKIKGLYLEFGVYKGQTINYISKNINSTIYGFDSFEGLPESWRDGFPKNYFKIDNIPKVNSNVKLIKGLFDQSLPLFASEHLNDKIAYLHIDCDLYSSTKSIFKYLGHKIISGTVIVFDEYFNYPYWQENEFKAFQEFIFENKLKYQYITYNNMHEQVAVIII